MPLLSSEGGKVNVCQTFRSTDVHRRRWRRPRGRRSSAVRLRALSRTPRELCFLVRPSKPPPPRVWCIAPTGNEGGSFRFPSLPPGNYRLTASLQGFQSRLGRRGSRLPGQIKSRLRAALVGRHPNGDGHGGVAVIDVRQSSRATSFRAEQVELLPKGRDFTTLVTQAPGANHERSLAASRSTAPAPARTATSSTASRPPISRTAPRARRHRRLRRRSAGQVERLRRGVRRRDRRRDQRRHEERHDVFHGSVLDNFEGSSLEGARRPTLAPPASPTRARRNTSTIRRTTASVMTRLRAGRPDRQEPHVVLRRLSAGADDQRSVGDAVDRSQPGRDRDRDDPESSGPVHHGEHYVAAVRQHAASRRLQQQLVEDRRLAAGAERHGSGRHELRQDFRIPELVGLGQPGLGRVAEALFGVRGGYYMSDQHDSNVTEEPLIAGRQRTTSATSTCRPACSAPPASTSIPTRTPR